MKWIRLFPSEVYDYAAYIGKSKSALPFYTTHSAGQQAMLNQLKNQAVQVYVGVKDRLPVMFLAMKAETIVNLLIADVPWLNWQYIFRGIDYVGKKNFQKSVRLAFQQPLNFTEQEILKNNGYQLQENEAQKELSYHTGLVLGGGGARGAYQIGVWQALKESAIPIEIITGTSVGALNGALIVQDDFEQAKNMWEKIETQQILSFPTKENPQNTLPELLSQIASFTVAAIQTMGVSTAPLQQLLDDTFSEEKLRQSRLRFFLVTTELPGMEEKVIPFNTCENGQWKSWLLASSSFFPAMAAARIKDKYYVDGGYRNNIPLDVAVANGATECIIVDVKGPGVTKRGQYQDIPDITLRSPWSLGNVLLFDGVRSTANIQLGYLEMMKALEKYRGYWYTFDGSLCEIERFQQKFFRYLKREYQLSLWKNKEGRKKFCQKLRKYYQDRVYEENISLVLLELLGKSEGISPTKLYTFSEFIEWLRNRWREAHADTVFEGMSSVQEWLGKYYDDFFLLSEKRQLQLTADLLQNSDSHEKRQRISSLFEQLPAITLQQLMKEFIVQEGEN